MLASQALTRPDTTSAVRDSLWTIGDVVRKLRGRKGWTQVHLAEAAGVNKATVTLFEANPERADRRTILRVVKALGITEADLYAYAEPVSLSAEQREYLKLLEDLESPRRGIVLALARRELEVQRERSIEAHSIPVADPSKTGTGT